MITRGFLLLVWREARFLTAWTRPSARHHPFHLHGFFFQVLEENDHPPQFLSWEDTVNVPAFGRVRIAWMPDDRRESGCTTATSSSTTPPA